MNYFSINLYPQGAKNRQRRVIVRQMDIIHHVLLISALVLTAVYLYFIVNSDDQKIHQQGASDITG